jgi:excisionase family DNA binding protein
MRINRRPKLKTKSVATAPTSDSPYFTVSEAAVFLRARRWTIAAAIREHKLPYVRMGKKFVLMRADLDAFALANRVDSAKQTSTNRNDAH